jgi:MFS family permease
MRIASRIVGVLLALAGFGFIAIPGYVFAVGQSSPDAAPWVLTAFLVSAGVGCLLAGKYFLRLNVDEPDATEVRPMSRFGRYFLAHRLELKAIAQAGLVISLIRLATACFGLDWPGQWATWPLFLVLIGLAAIGTPFTTDDLPRPFNTLVKGVEAAFLVLILLWAGSHYSHQQAAVRILQAGVIVVLFAREAVIFAYGKIRVR